MKKILTLLVITVCLGLITTPVFAVNELMLSTSQNLTAAAWAAFTGGTYNTGGSVDSSFSEIDYSGSPDYTDAIQWAEICVAFYGPRANAQKTGLSDFPTGTIAEVYADYWALNDVGTCYYIMGESYRLDNGGALDADAIAAFEKVIASDGTPGDYYYSQCAGEYDGNPILWKPATASYARLIGFTGATASSEALTVEAWNNLNAGNYADAITYADFCIDIYKTDAEAQKTAAQTYHDTPGSDTIADLYGDCYAYCDVAACWFIKAEALRKDGGGTKADCIATYQKVDSAGANEPASDNLPYGRVAMDGALAGDLISEKTWKVPEAADDRIELLNTYDWTESVLRY